MHMCNVNFSIRWHVTQKETHPASPIDTCILHYDYTVTRKLLALCCHGGKSGAPYGCPVKYICKALCPIAQLLTVGSKRSAADLIRIHFMFNKPNQASHLVVHLDLKVRSKVHSKVHIILNTHRQNCGEWATRRSARNCSSVPLSIAGTSSVSKAAAGVSVVDANKLSIASSKETIRVERQSRHLPLHTSMRTKRCLMTIAWCKKPPKKAGNCSRRPTGIHQTLCGFQPTHKSCQLRQSLEQREVERPKSIR